MDPDRFFEIEERMSSRDEPSYAFSKANFDWDRYARTRLVYPESLYKEILAHHEAHGGGFDTAHDIGAGYGLATRDFLSKHFKHVWTSDPVAHNLQAAKAQLKDRVDAGRVTVVEAAAEDEWLPSESVDLVTAFECLHWSDPEKSIPAIGAQLKPGGTFAAVYYMSPLLLDNPVADAAWSKIMHKSGLIWLDQHPKGAKRAQDGCNSSVPLPTTIFEPGARRIRINAGLVKPTSELRDARVPFAFGIKDFDQILSWSFVGKDDICEQREDLENWAKRDEVDAAWFRELVETFQLVPLEMVEDEL